MTAEANLSITSIAGLTNNPNQTITGTGAVGATVKVLDGTTLLGTTVVGSDGTWSELVALSGDGAHSITAMSEGAAIAPTVTTLVMFDGQNGHGMSLITDSAGKIYGTTTSSVFEITGAEHQTFNTLTTFNNYSSYDGRLFGDLALDASGDLYGTIKGGGRFGSVFELSGDSHEIQTTVFYFNGDNGSAPLAGVFADQSGNIFGTTADGGINSDGVDPNSGFGTVFQVSENSFTNLARFNNGINGSVNNGAEPFNLVFDAQGKLYGTTAAGGQYGNGTLFELTGTNHETLTTLFNFNGSNGSFPAGSLVLDPSGNIYGTNASGGRSGYGTAFKLSGPNHDILTTLVDFDATTGQRPFGLVSDSAGNLYGATTYLGGTNGAGIVFELSGSNHQTLTTLFNFSSNGSSGPYNSSGPYDLAIDGTDNLYVIMAGGGTFGAGGVLQLSGLNRGKETAASQSVTFSLDTIAPTITPLSQTSNNALATVAKAGDVITQLFTSTDTVTSVLINGQAASVVRESGNNYSATYTVQADSANGSADVVITAQDLAGNITSNTVADAMSWETLFSLNDSGADGTSTFGAYTSTSGISGSPVVSTTVKYDSSSRSSVYFNGTSQLDVINDPALNIGTQNIKISFEMKTDGYQNPYSVMINGINGTNGTDTSIGNDPAYGNVIHYWPGAGLPKIDGTININDANWHQVVATQVDGVASLFVDGTLENQQYVGVLNHDITQLRVGHLLGQWAGNWDNSFKGWIDNLTISSGSATSAQSVTIDTVDPIVSVLGQTSSNALTTVAKAGDVITQAFTSTDTVASVLINGQAASVVHGVGNNYTATYTVQTGSTNGLATANITAFDLAGNLASVSLTGGVAIDTVDPVITLLGQTSNNALATVAKAGDIITQSFTSTDAVTSVLINGQEASVVRGSGDSYTATYMVEMGSTNGVVNTVVSAQDAAGNTTAQSVAGSVTIDTVAPTFTHISALSNNSRNTFAKVGDVITETFTSTDIVTSVTINGQTASVVQGLGGNYTATYTVQTASLNGPAEVVIATQDLAGNVASSVFAGDTGWNTVFSLNPSGPDGSSNFGAYTSVSGISGSPIVSTTVKYDANSASSVYFNGTSQINVINDPALQIGSQNIKISFEMKADGYQTPYSTIIYSLGDVRGADTVIGNDPAYGNFVNFQPGNVSQYGPSWGFPNIAGTTNINDGSWHQVTTTQIDGVASIYVDGALENQQIVGLLNHDITNLAIGHLLGQYAGNWDNSFKGWIDDLTISSQSSTNNTGVTIDTIDPVITVLDQTSTNALTTVAKAGDVITQSFMSTDTVASVLIDGQAASVVHGLGNNYTATYTVQVGSTNGLAAANISAFDLAGNVASVSATGSVAIDTVAPIVAHISERTNAQSSMDFSIKSDDTYWSYWYGLQNNYTTQWHAPSILLGEGITDTSLLSFEATGLRYGFNNSLTDRMGDQSNAAGVIFPQSGSPGLATVVTLNLPNGVALTDTAPFGALLIGNPELGWKAVFSPTVGNGLNGALQTQVNRAPVSLAEMFGQSVAVGTKLFLTYNDQDTGNPGTYELSITSPDLGGLVSSTILAKAGDVITETFTATDTVTSVLINGQLASVAHRSGENYIASYTVQTSDSNGAADIVITARDAAGNVTTQNIAGSVTVDTVAPIVTHISELSNNAKNTLAKAGDIITESFISTDAVTGVSINGQAATVVHGLGNNYTATYTVQSNAMNGLADVIITAQDLVGNTSSKTVVGLVTVDTVAPTVSILSTGGVTKISTQTITGTGEAGTTVTLLDGTSALGTTLVNVDGTWSKLVTLSNQSIHSITALDSDAAGNSSYSAAVLFDIETSSNHAPTVSGPLTSTSAVRTQAFWSNLLAGASDADAGDHLSVTGLTYTVNGGASSAQAPSGIQLVNNQLLVDPSNTAFSNRTTGQSDTIVANYNITDDHGGSVAQTNTIIIGGPAIDPMILNNHAPTVAAPLATTFSKGSQAFWSNLLSGAADVDARNTLNVTDLRFSVAGAASTTVAPTGIQFANNQLLVDPNSTAFKDLTSGQTETIVASYNISDGYGGAVAQTNSLTVTGLGATSAGSNPNSSPSLISVAAALQSTSTAGTQGFWSNLLAGATNSNPNAHLDVANLRFSVNNSASTVITPVGIQYANKSIMVDPNNTAFRALAAGQSETIVASYNIVDGLGSSVAQTDTIIINGQGSQGASSGGVNTPTPNNHAPEVSAPVTAQAGVHTSAFWSNMLAGATDSDVGNQLHVSNVLFSLNGGVAVASAPTGIQVVNDQLLVDPNSTAFNHLGVGQADTIVASYNVIDGHGGSVAQTDTVTISGPVATVANGTITGTANHDILRGTSGNDTFLIGAGADTITGGRGADVFKYTSLSNSPTSSTAPTTTITDFSTTDGDRVDVTAILNGTSTLNSTIHVNQTGASNTSLSVTVGGVEYYIANVPNQTVSVPDAVANPASGATLTTALHGADWTTVVDVASAHGAPSTITAAGTATVTNATANPTGDWTAVVQAGAATVDTAQSQVTFAAAPTANAVSVQTADTTVHEVSNVTAVVWHL